MMVRYLDGDYQHVVARVRDGQCVSKYNNMVMSDIFWRITRHVNIPPLATPSPTLRLSSRRASVLHFQSFFFCHNFLFTFAGNFSRVSRRTCSRGVCNHSTTTFPPRGLYNGRHFQADSLTGTPLPGVLQGSQMPLAFFKTWISKVVFGIKCLM